MKKIIFVLLFSALFSFKTSNRQYCDIFGIVYFEPVRARAHFSAYIEEEEPFADMLVYKEENKLMADKKGVWYITDNSSIAHYRIFIQEEKNGADFSFAYVEESAFAGCKH